MTIKNKMILTSLQSLIVTLIVYNNYDWFKKIIIDNHILIEFIIFFLSFVVIYHSLKTIFKIWKS